MSCGVQPVQEGCFQPLVSQENDTAKNKFGGGLEVDGGTADLKHVVVSSQAVLTPGAPNSGLYEWTEPTPPAKAGALELLSLLPGGKPTGGKPSTWAGPATRRSTAAKGG